MQNKAIIIEKLIVHLLNKETRYDAYDLNLTHFPDGSYLVEVGRNGFLTIYHDDTTGEPYIQCMTVPPQTVINILNKHTMNKVEQAIEVFNTLDNVTNLPLASDGERLKATVDSSDTSKTIGITMYDQHNLIVANISKTIFYHGTFAGKEKVEAFGGIERLHNAVNVN